MKARTKLFGNAGRYFLPVANVINIKQARRASSIARTCYRASTAWDIKQRNGVDYASARSSAPQIGARRRLAGRRHGRRSARRSRPGHRTAVYQDEFILGFQQMFGNDSGHGASARHLPRSCTNAIDDMGITATPQCGDLNGGSAS